MRLKLPSVDGWRRWTFFAVFALSALAFAQAQEPRPPANVDTSFKTHPNSEPNRKILVVLLSFADRAITYANDQEWNRSFFGTTGATVRNFYDEESDGSLIFGPAAETSGTANDGIVKVTVSAVHPGTSGKPYSDVHTAIENLRTSIVEQIDANVDFKSFDKNGDGLLSSSELIVVLVCAGYEQALDPYSFPNIRGVNFTTPLNAQFDQVKFQNQNFIAAGEIHVRLDQGGKSEHRSTIGVYCHEIGHSLASLPDIPEPRAQTQSLMSNAHGSLPGQRSGETPVHLDPYSAIKLGVVKPIVANCSGIYSVNSLRSPLGRSVLRINTINSQEYFLVENRQLSGFDAALTPNAGYGGIAIWHIVENKGPANLVDFECAKVRNGYDQLIFRFFAQGTNYTVFDDSVQSVTETNSRLFDGTNSGISIKVLSSPAHEMNVDVTAPLFYFDTANKGPSLSSFSLSTNQISPNESVNVRAVFSKILGPIASVEFYVGKNNVPIAAQIVSGRHVGETPQGQSIFEATIDPYRMRNGLDSIGSFYIGLKKAVDSLGNVTSTNSLLTFNVIENLPTSRNLALGKTVSASNEIPWERASNAVNGIVSVNESADKWCSGAGVGNGSWLRVDLGSVQTINRWKVAHENASGSPFTEYFTKIYRLQTSLDGSVWKDTDTVDNTAGLEITDRPISPVKARYARLWIDEADSDNVARICEFQLFNDALTGFEANFEPYAQTQVEAGKRFAGNPQASNAILYSTQVSGLTSNVGPECAKSSVRRHSGESSLVVAGTDNSAAQSYAYFSVFDDVNIVVDEKTFLSYWVFATSEMGRYVAVDLEFTNGQTLRATGSVDQTGRSMHPGAGRGNVNEWNYVRSNIGLWCAGMTIKKVLVAYDQGPATGQFTAFVDDITVDRDLTASKYAGWLANFEPSAASSFVSRTPATLNALFDAFGFDFYTGKMIGKENVFNPSMKLDIGAISHSGNASLRFSGIAAADTSVPHRLSWRVYDQLNIPVTPTTKFSYWIRPVNELGRYVAAYVEFTDGSNVLSGFDVDQNGLPLIPDARSGRISGRGEIGVWNYICSEIGAIHRGKTIKSIVVAYDKTDASGTFNASIDDVLITK